MTAADVPIVMMLVSGAVLVICTALLTMTVPALRLPRWLRRRRPANPVQVVRRRAITGPPRALPPGPLPPLHPIARPPARQNPGRPNVQPSSDRIAEAEETIERLLDTDPERIARLMTEWIRDDRADPDR